MTAGLTKGQKVLHVPSIFEAASGASLQADDLQIMESVVVSWLHLAKDALNAKSEDFTPPVRSQHSTRLAAMYVYNMLSSAMGCPTCDQLCDSLCMYLKRMRCLLTRSCCG